jgi:AcrR family transcriptional regulator
MDTKEQLQQSYITYVLEHGRQPVSVFAFAKQLGIAETEFYAHFNSFDNLEQQIWKDLFERARLRTESQEVFEQYSVREKLLSLYYIWVEELKLQRSFVLFSANKQPDKRFMVFSPELLLFKGAFKDVAEELLREGRATGEVINRPFLTERYPDGLWRQTLFILNFWIKDPSQQFEQTDVAIEKAVNMAFDLIGKTPLDTIFDFTKFLFQNRSL